MINTVIGALIAAMISFGSGALALLAQEGVNDLSDVKVIAWTVLGLGALLNFAKDFQAIWARMKISNMTGSTDGGGPLGPLPMKKDQP